MYAAIGVFDKVQKWSPGEKTKMHLKRTIKCFKKAKICKLPEMPY